jgi:hypothetical protein
VRRDPESSNLSADGAPGYTANLSINNDLYTSKALRGSGVRWYCTYFDKHYFVRGLALYESLRKHCSSFALCVVCLDRESHAAITTMKLPFVYAFSLSDVEKYEPTLRDARSNRTLVEYYYTLTPVIILYIFHKIPEAKLVTYLDSDLYFFNSPDPLFDELKNNSISIIGHRFPDALLHLTAYGIYNVAWLTFRRDDHGMSCLRWWRDRCIEWCYDRLEEGRFADQKYLDDWPERFSRVVELRHKGANVAPWNLGRWNVRGNGSEVLIDDEPLIFFHFHRFRRVAPFVYDTNLARYGVRTSSIIRRGIFRPYVRTISNITNLMKDLFPRKPLGLGMRKEETNFVAKLKYSLRSYRRALQGDFIFVLE